MDDDLDDVLEDVLNSAKKITRKRPRKAARNSDDDDEEYGTKASARKKKTRGRGKGRASDSDTPGDDDDDDDASDSESSDASSNEDEDEDNDGYGPDLMGDAQDRANLMAMTEIQREKILSERSEQREARRARLALKRKAREIERREHKAQLQKSIDKKAKRQVKEAERAAKRAAKLARDKEIDENKGLTRRSQFSVDASEALLAADEARQVPLLLEDLRKAQVSRIMLHEWQWLPNFGDIVKDAFVRVQIGMGSNQQKTYRVAQISRVTKYHRTYEFEKRPTDRALELRIGASKRVFQLSFVSNMAITEPELQAYIKALQTGNQRIPNARTLEPVVETLKAARDHEMTPEEQRFMIAEKSRIRSRPRNAVTERAELERLLQIAVQEDQAEEVKRLQGELDELNELAAEEMRKRDEHLLNLAELNRRSREKQMQIELDWSNKEGTKASAADTEFNPFQRRRVVVSNIPREAPSSPSKAGLTSPAAVPALAEVKSSPSVAAAATPPTVASARQQASVSLDLDFDLGPPAVDLPISVGVVPPPSMKSPAAAGSGTPGTAPARGRAYNLSLYNSQRGIL